MLARLPYACPHLPGRPAPRASTTPRTSTTRAASPSSSTSPAAASHDIVEQGLTALRNLEHRGASGAEPDTGDGAGILSRSRTRSCAPGRRRRELPDAGHYAVGTAFLPDERREPRSTPSWPIERDRRRGGPAGPGLARPADRPRRRGHRPAPRARSCRCSARCSSAARPTAPTSRRTRSSGGRSSPRKRAEHETGAYFPSLSTRTLVYKGMLTTDQLQPFFPDLSDERFASALALVHSRFSTNTFPSWPLAHPYRYIAHNGEINTVKGNRNWMRAREALLRGPHELPDDLSRLFPICTPGASDSRQLRRGARAAAHGRPLAAARGADDGPGGVGERARHGPGQARLLRVPRLADGAVGRPGLRDLHRRHADRRGARPQRPAARALVADRRRPGRAGHRGRRARHPGRPGRRARAGCSPAGCSSSTPRRAGSSSDDEIKAELAAEHPYADWLHTGLLHARRAARSASTSSTPRVGAAPPADLRLHRGGAAHPARRRWRRPAPSRSARWAPTPRSRCCPSGRGCCSTTSASCSRRSPTRRWTRSARSWSPAWPARIGPEQNLLEPVAGLLPADRRCRSRCIDNDELAKISHVNDGRRPAGLRRRHGLRPLPGQRRRRGAARRPRPGPPRGVDGHRRRRAHHRAVRPRLHRAHGADPVAAAHLRGAPPPDPREDPHPGRPASSRPATPARCTTSRCSIGYGAAAVNPYLAFETIEDLIARRRRCPASTLERGGAATTSRPLGKGVLKVMSKMGISTIASYTGAQVFEALGLSQELVDEYFTGTTSRLGGIGLEVIAEEVAARHRRAYPANATERAHRGLEVGGEYQWRREGEVHLFNPETVFALQHSTRTQQYDVFQELHVQGRRAVGAGRHAARAVRAARGAAPAGRRSTRSSRSSEIVQALQHRRDVATARSRPRRTRRSPSR